MLRATNNDGKRRRRALRGKLTCSVVGGLGEIGLPSRLTGFIFLRKRCRHLELVTDPRDRRDGEAAERLRQTPGGCNASLDGLVVDDPAAPAGVDRILARHHPLTIARKLDKHLHDLGFDGLNARASSELAQRRSNLHPPDG